jgi:hypothetical protein
VWLLIFKKERETGMEEPVALGFEEYILVKILVALKCFEKITNLLIKEI